MRKKYIFGKKLYISILTMIVVLITTVATTFAWVGVFANATFDLFEINIKSIDLEEYGIEISMTGNGGWTDNITGADVKKAILLNWGYSEEDIDYNGLDQLFATLNMEQVTTKPTVSGNKLVSIGNNFTDMRGTKTKKYYKFDIYVSAKQYYDSGSGTPYNLDCWLEEGLITGTTKYKQMKHEFVYPQAWTNPLTNLPTGIRTVNGGEVLTGAQVDSKSVARVGFEKYAVVDKNHPEQYTESSTPVSSIIYSGDTYDYPTYNTLTNVYEFGGILNDDINLAVGYYNSTEWWYDNGGVKSITCSGDLNAGQSLSSKVIDGSEIYNIRGVGKTTADKPFNSKNNHLIDSANPLEQIGTQQMMKMTVYFWLEGWDADCFNVVGGSPMTLNVSMSIKQPDKDF